VLLMDEPFAALDAHAREASQDELLSILRRTGTTVVFITHSIDEAIYLGQRVLVMAAAQGRITHSLPVHVPKGDPTVGLRATPEFVRLRHQIWQLIRSRRSAGHLQVAHAAQFNFEGASMSTVIASPVCVASALPRAFRVSREPPGCPGDARVAESEENGSLIKF
jgi:ABC-type proline/glycine betaine transport system ATPase subunit